MATTVNEAVDPSTTLLLAGWVEMVGGRFTVSGAELLVLVPAEFLTLTLKVEPLSVLTVAGVVYEAAVAPVIAVPFFDH